MLLRSKSNVVCGLDIGASSIKMVKLENKGGNYAVKAMGSRDLPVEAIVSEDIKDRDSIIFNLQSLIEQTDPKTRDVVISISGHGVITDRITIDKKTGAEAEQAILFEAEQRSPFDVEDVTLDYHIIDVNEGTNKMDVLLVAARNEFLKTYMDIIQDAGLKPVVVDTDAFAILNSYEINYELDPERVTALVNIGYDITNVTFLKDGKYHSTRDISSGGRMIFDAIQKEFRLNQELTHKAIRGEMEASIDQDMLKATIVTSIEEMITGLEVAFSYFKSLANVPNIDWIILSGGGALIPYLPEFVQSKLNIPIEIANPLRNIEYDPDMFSQIQPEKIAPLLSVAIGLAARKVR
ncbi:MAG: type IV pilus assembly protein PilM [candidate division Zixibacteria bacterium]|jgi:type IV pilus assembly protein PilM|nr:type IV pilus assembly protein PilM [candidate division Zixibacteria bacterium]NIR63206.1 type IV pilus assembly protein PilM [candidate division Zixibacteria bacterium]NIS16904.1 type IV pilus assembly protein PilM [candidate division Zixibacteria bacterium]NIS45183.1 type IV pilus assembly protein PilM [candidate division Zixibacteria bacterium]NIT51756.1 type IV pilus assembly protein PilM [candidate division Zixibacteria bacterium]